MEGGVLDAIGVQLVYRKHEGIPLHYRNITKHKKAKTGLEKRLAIVLKKMSPGDRQKIV